MSADSHLGGVGRHFGLQEQEHSAALWIASTAVSRRCDVARQRCVRRWWINVPDPGLL